MPVTARSVVDGLPVGAVVLDGRGRVAAANDRAAVALGRPADRLAGLDRDSVAALAAEAGWAVAWGTGEPVVGILVGPAGDRAGSLLARAGAALVGSLNLDRTLLRLARLAVDGLADAAVVALVDGTVLHRAAAARTAAGVEVRAGTLRVEDAIGAVLRVRSRSEPELHAAVDDDELADLLPKGEGWSIVGAVRPSSAMVVPLRAKGRTTGAAVLLATGGRRFHAADLDLAGELAHLGAQALDNALVFRERSDIAVVLQRGLLPPVLPSVPGVELGAAYRPAAGGGVLGGDFYDVFPIDPARWGVTVGDVCGKGVTAAALTGLARVTVRAAATRGAGPAGVLEAVGDAIAGSDAGDTAFCTAVFAELEPRPCGVHVTLASGGHPKPFLIRPGRPAEEVDVRGILLGAFPRPALVERHLDLAPGDALVLYTDGLAEARSGREQFGTGRIGRVLDGSAATPAPLVAERLVAEVEAFAGGRVADDLAVLVVRATG